MHVISINTMSTAQSDTSSNATEVVMAQYEQQFQNLNKSLVGFRSQITALQQQLRTIEKSVRKEMNTLKQEDMELVYFEPKGQLYYNHNDEGKGFGRSGR